MSEGAKNQPVSGSGRDFASLRALGIAVLGAFLYLLLVDAAIETFRGGSSVRWWVSGLVAGYLGITVLLWRRIAWTTKATLSFLLLLGLLVFSTWWRWPEGFTKGLRLAGQPTATVLSAVTALAILLAGTALVRIRSIPLWGRALIGVLVLYAVAAFGMGVVAGVSYPDLFRGRSLWQTFPFWLQGALVGALVLAAAILAQLVDGLFRARGLELRMWGAHTLALSLSLVMVAGGLREALRAAPAPGSE